MTAADEMCTETYEDALKHDVAYCRAQIDGLVRQRAEIWATHHHTPTGDDAVRVITREIRAWRAAERVNENARNS